MRLLTRSSLAGVGTAPTEASGSGPLVEPPIPGADPAAALPVAAAPPQAKVRLARVARIGVVCADASAIVGAMVAALALQPSSPLHSGAAYRQVGLASLPLWLLAFHRYHLYNSRHVASHRDELARVVHAVGLGVLLTALVAYGLDQIVERSWFVLVFLFAGTAVAVERMVVRRVFARLRRRGLFVRRVVVAGTGCEAAALVTMLSEHTELGYVVVGLLGDGQPVHSRLAGTLLPVLDSRADAVESVRRLGAGGVLVATTDVGIETSNRLVRSLTDGCIHVEMSSSLRDIDAERLSVRPLGCFPMVYVEPCKRGGWRPGAKRVFDVVVSSLAMVAVLPLMAVAAVAIKATSPGPVLFRQERVGWHGRRFRIFKLRSMYVDGDERLRNLAIQLPDGPVVKLQKDPRVTRVGHVLRKLSLDEVPQLVNVVRGDMSLVGPRPEQPCEVVLWTPEQFDRLRVRPGLTGMWQISGRSAARGTKDRLDLYYVDNWSIWRDLAILLKTVPVVLSSKGAY